MAWKTSYKHASTILDRYDKFSPLAVVFGLVLVVFLWYLITYQQSPLRKYPGPTLAGWTNGWRFYTAVAGKHAPIIKEVHDKYGPVVRTGPNLLELNIPSLIRTIYSTDGQWRITDFYKNNGTVIDGNIFYNLFSETNPVKHAAMKRPIIRHYSISNVLATEPLMDKVIDELCGHLEKRFVETGRLCCLDEWLKHFAWDFVSAVTLSKRFGYMERGYDFDGSQHIGDQAMDYLGIVGQMPWLDHWLDKNPIVHLGPPNLGNATRIAAESLFRRLEGKDENFDPQKPDFMQYYIDSKASHPEVVDNATIISYLLLNLVAGTDTTAITMKALFYYCLRSPRAWTRLNEDVLAAKLDPAQTVSYSAAKSIPYLDAVARETMRVHPAASMTMERVVPDSGLALPDGSVVPGGATVGMNPYAIARNKDIFGANADEFIPDRWLQQEGEGDEKYQDRMRLWNASDLRFGAGSRICIGRHLSQMELYKLVGTLITRYEIELVDATEEWKPVSRWFYRVDGGLTCRLRKRNSRHY